MDEASRDEGKPALLASAAASAMVLASAAAAAAAAAAKEASFVLAMALEAMMWLWRRFTAADESV